MFSPTEFFGGIREEEGYKESTKFLFITLLFVSFLFLFFLAILPGSLKEKFILEFSRTANIFSPGEIPLVAMSLLAIVEIFILGFVGTIVGSAVIHIFAEFSGRKI